MAHGFPSSVTTSRAWHRLLQSIALASLFVLSSAIAIPEGPPEGKVLQLDVAMPSEAVVGLISRRGSRLAHGLAPITAGSIVQNAEGGRHVQLAVDLRTIGFLRPRTEENVFGSGSQREEPVLLIDIVEKPDGPANADVIWMGRQVRQDVDVSIVATRLAFKKDAEGEPDYWQYDASLTLNLTDFELGFEDKPLGEHFQSTIELSLFAGFATAKAMPPSSDYADINGKYLSPFWTAMGKPDATAEFWLAMLAKYDTGAANLMDQIGVNRESVEALFPSKRKYEKYRGYQFDEIAYRSNYEWAHTVASDLGANEVTSAHVLIAIVEHSPADLRAKLDKLGLDPKVLRAALQVKLLDPDEVEELGQPSRVQYRFGDSVFARNIWTMHAFDNRIFIGIGNSNNDEPAPNAGPVPVWAFNIATGEFVEEAVLEDEQIDVYREIDGTLWVPGHDPREDWSFGNIYQRTPDGWEKTRNLPDAMHAYDVLEFEDKVFVAGGRKGAAVVWISADKGQTWEANDIGGGEAASEYRAHTLFVLGGQLYVQTYLGQTFRFDAGQSFQQVSFDLFPGAKPAQRHYIKRYAALGDQLAYIGVNNVTDHQWMPFGLYVAKRPDFFTTTTLPILDVPFDVKNANGAIHVLTNQEPDPLNPDAPYLVAVWRSTDLENWEEVLRFASPTFARSFAILGDDYYFGLGTTSIRLNADAGKVLRVKGKAKTGK